MADYLILCKTCKEEVSNKAKTCPHCGRRLKMALGWKVVIAVVVIAAFPSFWHGVMSSSFGETLRGLGASTESSTPEPAPVEAMEVSYQKLYKDYSENAIRADSLYKGKLLKLTGKVADINREIAGEPYVTFAIDDFIKNVRLTFQKTEESKIADLRKGQTITVEGTCGGLLLETS